MVWLKFSSLPTWQMDKEETKTLPHYSSDPTYDKQGRILAQIKEINIYSPNPYITEFSVYEGGIIKQITYPAFDHSIAFKEESFLNILDELEKVEVSREKDCTPF